MSNDSFEISQRKSGGWKVTGTAHGKPWEESIPKMPEKDARELAAKRHKRVIGMRRAREKYSQKEQATLKALRAERRANRLRAEEADEIVSPPSAAPPPVQRGIDGEASASKLRSLAGEFPQLPAPSASAPPPTHAQESASSQPPPAPPPVAPPGQAPPIPPPPVLEPDVVPNVPPPSGEAQQPITDEIRAQAAAIAAAIAGGMIAGCKKWCATSKPPMVIAPPDEYCQAMFLGATARKLEPIVAGHTLSDTAIIIGAGLGMVLSMLLGATPATPPPATAEAAQQDSETTNGHATPAPPMNGIGPASGRFR
jgi:hypothetical protein